MSCRAVWADEVVDLRVDADNLLACQTLVRSLVCSVSTEKRCAPMISLAGTLGYFRRNSSTIGIAASASSATEKMISNLG